MNDSQFLKKKRNVKQQNKNYPKIKKTKKIKIQQKRNVYGNAVIIQQNDTQKLNNNTNYNIQTNHSLQLGNHLLKNTDSMINNQQNPMIIHQQTQQFMPNYNQRLLNDHMHVLPENSVIV